MLQKGTCSQREEAVISPPPFLARSLIGCASFCCVRSWIAALRVPGTLAGRFIEEDSSGCSRVERFDAAGHRYANARVGAALDFFRKAGAFVADQERDGFAPIDLPGRE